MPSAQCRKIVAVRHREEALAALARDTGRAATLLATHTTTRFVGVGYLKALEDEIGRPILVDCGDEAGLLLAGLRAGLKRLVFTGPQSLHAKLQAIADEKGTVVMRGEMLETELSAGYVPRRGGPPS